MADHFSPFLVGISLAGAYAITVARYRRYGFLAWVIADFAWVIYFVSMKQAAPAVLFLAYTVLAAKGWCEV